VRGDETNGPTPTIEPEEGVWQFEGDEEHVWAAREALKRRGEKVMATVWSPPAWMKTNACVHDGGELRRDKYQAFADYLSRYVREWRDRFGIELCAISPANEPDLVTKYSSCIWSANSKYAIRARLLAPTFRRTA
jgi:glucuronoarabinoxylan endo-1,4-beta-xylanase